MSNLPKRLVLAAAVALAPAIVFAQDTATQPQTPAPAAPAPAQQAAPGGQLVTGAENAGVNQPYVAATHADWQMRCVKTEEGKDPCQLYQLLKDEQGNNVAEFSLFALPPGQQAAAGATIITPLETLLTQQVSFQIDSAPAKHYPFGWCAPVGCIARVGFTSAEVDALKRGNAATMTIVPVAAPDHKVNLKVSLKGFTAGYDAVTKANADNQ